MLSATLDDQLGQLASVQAVREAVGYRASCEATKPLADLLACTYGAAAARPHAARLATVSSAGAAPVPRPDEWQTIGGALQLVQDAHHAAWSRKHPQYAQAAASLGGAQPGVLHRLCTVYLPTASWVEHWPADDGGMQLDGIAGRAITALRAAHPALDPALARDLVAAVDALPLAASATVQ